MSSHDWHECEAGGWEVSSGTRYTAVVSIKGSTPHQMRVLRRAAKRLLRSLGVKLVSLRPERPTP